MSTSVSTSALAFTLLKCFSIFFCSAPLLPSQPPSQAVPQPPHCLVCCEVSRSLLLQSCRPVSRATPCSLSAKCVCKCFGFPSYLLSVSLFPSATTSPSILKVSLLLPLILWQPVCELVPCPAHPQVFS